MECRRIFIVLAQVLVSSWILCINKVLSQKQPAAPACPQGWTSVSGDTGGTCVWLSTNKASWINAMNWCQVLGGHLAEVNSNTLNTHLTRLVRGTKPEKYWIGLTNVKNNHVYQWMTSKQVFFQVQMASLPYFFKPGQSLGDRAKQCVNMDDKGEWLLDSCKTECLFVCQK